MSRISDREDLSKLDLSSCVPSCVEQDFNPRLVEALILAQNYAKLKFTITSGFRTQAYEREKGRNGSSSHCRRLAVDISARDSHVRYKVVASCLMAGFPRIGIGKTFVHVDLDETKAHPIIFHYYE